MESAFLTGDNSIVVPTDTCKNTVYCVAKLNNFESIEEFGLLLCKHFLKEYPEHVNKITVEILQDNWERLTLPSSRGTAMPHKHAFKRSGPTKQYARVIGEKRKFTPLSLTVVSGFKSLDILKTTQSSFTDFHRCKYTSLPEVSDRLFGTSADVEWQFNSAQLQHPLNFNQVGNAYLICSCCMICFVAGGYSHRFPLGRYRKVF